MPALKQIKVAPQTQPETETPAAMIREVSEDHDLSPVASPAHDLRQALHDAGFRSEGMQQRPMSNVMLVMSLICVYALAMMMMVGSLTA